MENREIALILLNMQLDMDYADTKQYGKETVDILEEEIATLKKRILHYFMYWKISQWQTKMWQF